MCPHPAINAPFSRSTCATSCCCCCNRGATVFSEACVAGPNSVSASSLSLGPKKKLPLRQCLYFCTSMRRGQVNIVPPSRAARETQERLKREARERQERGKREARERQERGKAEARETQKRHKSDSRERRKESQECACGRIRCITGYTVC